MQSTMVVRVLISEEHVTGREHEEVRRERRLGFKMMLGGFGVSTGNVLFIEEATVWNTYI